MSNKTLRKHAMEILDAGIEAVNPERCVFEHASVEGKTLKVKGKSYDLSSYKGIYVVSFGKAAPAMAAAAEKLLGDRITDGIVVSNSAPASDFAVMKFMLSSHPVPDEKSARAADEIMKLLEKTGKNDLVLFLISGGGSSMLAKPREGLSLVDKRKVTEQLLVSGVDTYGLNTVRKKLSSIKGGGLLRQALPSEVVTLILSDVVGDNLEMIASGPTVEDTTTFKEAWRVVEALGVEHQIPPRVVVELERGMRDETNLEKPVPPGAKVRTEVVGNNSKCVSAAEEKARALGYSTLVLSSQIRGEAKEVAKCVAAIALDVERFGKPLETPACVIFGGETTVNVKRGGRGGRNTETALSFCMEVVGHENIVGLFAGTDGIDGPTDAAGAICDGASRLLARKRDISARNHLMENDSYTFFESLDDLIKTGSTGTNVMDIGIVLVETPE
ncbi:MAG: glycerate kinase type-2 family protein [Thermodesulfobacteriota bacterium]